MILVQIFLFFSSFHGHHATTLPQVTCSKTTANAEPAEELSCSIPSDTSVNPIECEIASVETCQATFTSHEKSADSGEEKRLNFNLKIMVNAYTTSPVQFVLKQNSGGNKVAISQNHQITITFKNEEKPRVICHEQKSTLDIFTYYATCETFVSQSSDTLSTSEILGCTVTISYTDSVKENKFIYSKIATLTFKPTNKHCNTNCGVKISVPGGVDNSNPATTKQYNFGFTCDVPHVNIAGHDEVSRKISFNVQATYEFNKIAITSKNTNLVTLLPAEFTVSTETEKNQLKEITYTVLNPSSGSKVFTLEFQIYQGTTHIAHRVEKPFSYVLLDNEEESIQCNVKSADSPQNSPSTIYDCNIMSRTAQITLQAEKIGGEQSTFSISPSTPITLTGNKQLKTMQQDVTLTSANALCNQQHQVKIKFQATPSIYTLVSHVTHCPDPTITCSNHDLAKREISCSIQIDYDYIKLEIVSSSQVVEISPASINVANLPTRTANSKRFEYKLKDLRKTANPHFNVIFKVIQKRKTIASETSLGFKYLLRSEEMPHINCSSIDHQTRVQYASNTYRCAMTASMWKVPLKLRQENFLLSPEFVTGHSYNEIYKHSGFDVVVTPKTIKCHDVQDITIYFIDDTTIESEFKIKHKTTCPDPIINCDVHDEVGRSVKCLIKIAFPFHTVGITVAGNAEIKETTDILYTEYSKFTDYSHIIKYDVTNRASTDHEFRIEFKVYHGDTKSDEVFTITRRFEYILKQDEIPSLVCKEKSRTDGQALDETKYICTIISKSQLTAISVEQSDAFTVNAVIPQSSQIQKGIIKIDDLEVTIKANKFKCNNPLQVQINFMDNQIKYSYTVTHQTHCPDPVVYCKEHNSVLRELTCKFEIKYKFDSIVAFLTPSHVKFESSAVTKTVATSGLTFDSEQIIKYEIHDYKITNHNFQFKIEVNQPDNTKSFERSFPFKYVLKIEESPHISCIFVDPVGDQKFEESKYRCKIISIMTKPNVRLESPEYSIEQTANTETDHKNLKKQDAATFTVKPNRIICERTSKIVIYFKDQDDKTHKDIISHSTNCPPPSVLAETHTTSSRKLTWNIEARYEFRFKEFASSVATVKITPKPGPITRNGDKWSGSVEVTYEPLDWSYDDHKFSVLSKVTPTDSHDIEVTTASYDFKRIDQEKSSITCKPKGDEKDVHFTEKVYLCSVQSRQSIIQLRVAESGYVITQQSGVHKKDKNVYHWKDFLVKIRDLQIKCNVNMKLSISFIEYGETFGDSITYRTVCPNPEISCLKNDSLRHVICEVDAEFRHTELDVKSVGAIQLSNTQSSSITQEGVKWHSNHIIPYALTNLKSFNFEFTLTLTVFQDDRNINVKTLTFSYVLREDEQPQITCQKEKREISSAFDTSKYVCYIVATQDKVTLSVLPSYYKLEFKLGTQNDFLGFYKWQNVKVTLKDERILCNTTSDVTIKVQDGAMQYENVVQHTTNCDQIDGNCEIQYKEYAFIRCNFTSTFAFELKDFSCSEFMNCTKSADLVILTSKYQEYMFDVKPLIYKSVLDFDFNITLSYSEFSNVSLTYKMEYFVQTDADHHVKEASGTVAAASTGLYSSFFVILPGCLMTVALVYVFTKPKPQNIK